MSSTNFHQPDPRRRGDGDGNDGGGGGGPDVMTKTVYDTNNSGRVDYSEKVFGVDTATVSQYYGKNAAGTIGFFDLPAGGIGGADLDAQLLIWQGI